MISEGASKALMTAPMGAEEESVRRRAAALFPSFDPNYGTAPAEGSTAGQPAPRSKRAPAPRPRLEHVTPQVLETNQRYLAQEQQGTTQDEPEDDVVRLPEVTVEEKRLPRTELPRLRIETPKEHVQIDEFMTEEAKAEALIREHLSGFDRLVLNRFDLLGSKAARALAAERREQFARAMNDLAGAIEQSAVWGVTEEEKEQLKKEYYNLMVNGPK